MQTEWRTIAIDQHMPFGAGFGTIGRIWSGGCAAQGRGQQFGIGRLPAPIDTADLVVQAQQSCENGSEDASLFPFLQTAVQGRARAKPCRSGFPLATGSQHIQNTVQHSPKRYRRASISTRRLFGRKKWLDREPHRIGNFPERWQVSAL